MQIHSSDIVSYVKDEYERKAISSYSFETVDTAEFWIVTTAQE